MKSLEELRNFFNSDLIPELQVLEKVRKEQVYRQVYIIVAMAISITLAIILILPTLLLVFMGVFLIIYFLMFGFKRRRFDYKKSYKETVLKKVITFLFDDAVYTPFRFIPEIKFEESRLFITDPAIYNGEDLVQGKMYSIAFQYAELHTQDRVTDSDGKTTFPTIFKGLCFIADMQQDISGEIFILSDFSEKYTQLFNGWYKDINTLKPEKITVQNVEFNQSFSAVATEQDEAEKMLTPALINLILEYRKKSKVNVQLAIRNQQLFIALPERSNLFDVSMYRSLLKFDDIEQYYKDLSFCAESVRLIRRDI